jgi:DNA-binding MarR family transcriptional regulator
MIRSTTIAQVQYTSDDCIDSPSLTRPPDAFDFQPGSTLETRSNSYIAPEWERALLWASNHVWTKLYATTTRGKAKFANAQTCRDVFLACIERSMKDKRTTFHASAREIAELARVNKVTANRGLRALVKAGYLKRAGSTPRLAWCYEFGEECLVNYAEIRQSPTTVCILHSERPGIDTFVPGCLPKSTELVWDAILMAPKRVPELCDELHMKQPTIWRALNRLKEQGLATCTGRVWTGVYKGNGALIQIAKDYGTYGRARRRREMHQHERRGFEEFLRRQSENKLSRN